MRLSGDLRLLSQAAPDRLVQSLRQALGDELASNVAADVRKQIRSDALPAAEVAELVLNLRTVTEIDSLGIGALVRIPIECAKRGINLKVVMPAATAREALSAVRIFAAWPQFATEEEAFSS